MIILPYPSYLFHVSCYFLQSGAGFWFFFPTSQQVGDTQYSPWHTMTSWCMIYIYIVWWFTFSSPKHVEVPLPSSNALRFKDISSHLLLRARRTRWWSLESEPPESRVLTIQPRPGRINIVNHVWSNLGTWLFQKHPQLILVSDLCCFHPRHISLWRYHQPPLLSHVGTTHT